MEVNLRIAGAAGQGIQTAADLLGQIACRSGLYAYGYTDAESRIRGGINFSQMRVSEEPRMGVTEDFDILVALNRAAEEQFQEKITEGGALICEEDCKHPQLIPFSLQQLAQQAGSPLVASTVGVATLSALLGISRENVERTVAEHFSSKPKLLETNQQAVRLGYQAVADSGPGAKFRLSAAGKSDRLWLAGHQAVSLGAVAGGVSFVAGYPMSPATNILTDLADWSRNIEMLFEQAEDEIAAINMVAGASYAGARAMTATSGGGFCLMTEGVSLLGMIEAPAVIVLGQRPGPATGLPTRTAQGDLHLALHAGHGFFPRVILAPKNIPDCFELTARAFDIAERFQVPVFVLTDQLLLDSSATVEPFDWRGLPAKRHLLDPKTISATEPYRRYQLTPSGISPQLAPGTSSQLVVVDSDEHDQDGHMIESKELATQMASKRLRKSHTLSEAELLPPPKLEGNPEQALVVSWGSTFETLAAARNELAASGKHLSHLHLRQLWPLPEKLLREIVGQASRVVVVENNVGGELDTLLRRVALRPADAVLNGLDGRPFSVTDLLQRLEEVLP